MTSNYLTICRFAILAAMLGACAGKTPVPATVKTGQLDAAPVERYTGLSAPVSVLYDAEHDRYLVSNVNGSPNAKDDNGFISILSPDGQIGQLKWIDGSAASVRLDAPKGLAIADGVLYVTDIDVVRQFDLHTGSERGVIAFPGSTYLNDVATGSDGKIYVSDSGPPTGRFDAKGTEAIYVIDGQRAQIVAKGALGRPNSVVWTERGLVVSPFGSNEIYRLDAQGKRQDVTKAPVGGLAGIVQLGEHLYVTSWQSSSVLRGKLGGTFEVALADQKSPADLGYDSKRARLLVPHFTEDSVDAFQVR